MSKAGWDGQLAAISLTLKSPESVHFLGIFGSRLWFVSPGLVVFTETTY